MAFENPIPSTDLRKVMKMNRQHSLLKHGHIQETLKEHQAVIIALEAHDPQAATGAMQLHFENGLEAAT